MQSQLYGVVLVLALTGILAVSVGSKEPQESEASPTSCDAEEARSRPEPRPRTRPPNGASDSYDNVLAKAKVRVDELENRIRGESRDAAWADLTERVARERVEALGAVVKGLRCGATLCLVSFTADRRSTVVRNATMSNPFSYGSFAFFVPNTKEAKLFFAREGHDAALVNDDRRASATKSD